MNDESFIIALSESVCGHVYIDKVGRVQKEELQDDIYISGGSRGTYIRSTLKKEIPKGNTNKPRKRTRTNRLSK
jgi:hypothetical protein